MSYAENYEERVKISTHNVLTYDVYIGPRRNAGRERSNENLSLNHSRDDISKKAQRRLLAAMDWLLLFSRDKYAMNLKKGKLFSYRLALLTLTLPAKQFHPDNYIKKYLLNEFLTRLRKDYKLQNYLWKAEKQMNGNIHFHIVVDRYMYFKDVNRIWNKILDNHGYIEKYRDAQLQQHAAGFTPRKDLFQVWNYAKQLKAYKTGIETNWKNPSATSDIHSLRKIKNAKAYLSKYLTKNPDTNKFFAFKISEYKKMHRVKNVPQSFIDELRIIIQQSLSVQGNLWYICRNLSKVKGCISDLSEDMKKELSSLKAKFKDKVEQLERCQLFKFNIFQLIENNCMSLARCFAGYLAKFRSLFYPESDQERYTLGIPLNIFEEN